MEYEKSLTLPLGIHIANLIHSTEEEMVKAKMQEWIYFMESLKPVHIGKAEAEKNMGTWQKRAQFLKENIEVYRQYAQQHGITI